MSFLKMIVGLGNPGREYADTRHNTGFKVVDLLAEVDNCRWQEKPGYLISEATIAGERVRLLKPQSYMNNSGAAVAELARFYKVAPGELLVIHDEIDLPFGSIRIKQGGGDAGNNGLRSVTAHLGTSDYIRQRVGVGKPEHPGMDVSAWVLGKFTAEEKAELPGILSRACKAAMELAENGLKHAQNRFNN